MVAEMITLKLDKKFLKEVDALVKVENYHSRTEFIREALRGKIHEIKYRQAYEKLKKVFTMPKGPAPTEKEYEKIRQEAAEEIYNERFSGKIASTTSRSKRK